MKSFTGRENRLNFRFSGRLRTVRYRPVAAAFAGGSGIETRIKNEAE
jgi:hypothetical protein